MSHTDIKSEGWIARLPTGVRSYALLMRLDRPIGTWLLLLPGWWSILLAGAVHGIGTGDILYMMGLFALGAVVMRGAGCVVNDLWDRDLDRMVSRTAARPLASGAISVRQAVMFIAVLSAIGFLILIQMNMTTILLGVASLGFIVLYPLMKRITWWPQAFLGLTFNFGALMGWTAMAGALETPAIILYIAGFFWTLGYDTIYALQDREDDLTAGIKSTALKFGMHSIPMVGMFYSLAWILIVKGFAMAGAPLESLVILGVGAGHLIWQVRKIDPANPASALSMFRSNRDFGLIVAVAAIMGFVF
jgi:4-hydroxybenzoate polyprenyltransferase